MTQNTERRPDPVKHILIHMATPASGAIVAFILALGGKTLPQAALLSVGGAMLLFYAFNQTIEHMDARLNQTDAKRIH